MSVSACDPTPQEMQWAIDLKHAAIKERRLVGKRASALGIDAKSITDLEFFHQAVVCRGDIELALTQICNLHDFKTSVGIVKDGSTEAAMRDFRAYQATLPRNMLSLARVPRREDDGDSDSTTSGDAHVVCIDHVTKKKFGNDESLKVCMRAIFYMLQASQCDLRSMRGGLFFLMDSRRTGWQNFKMFAEDKVAQLCSAAYPIRIRQVVYMGLSSLGLWLYWWFRRSCPPCLRDKIVLRKDRWAYLYDHRYQFPPAVLPIPWGGNIALSDFSGTIEEKLKMRYEWADSFVLPEKNCGLSICHGPGISEELLAVRASTPIR